MASTHEEPDEELTVKDYVKIWDRVIQVQQHFNDLCLRIRTFSVAVLGGLLTAGAFAVKDGLSINIWWFEVPAALPILGIAFVAWAAFYMMDYYWYHQLLLGAVLHGDEIEKRHGTTLPELGLTQSISAQSTVTLPFRKKPMRSSDRLRLFYRTGFALIAVIGLTLLPDVHFASPTLKERHLLNKSGTADLKSTDAPALRARALKQSDR